MLAATGTGLAEIIVSSRRVPACIREALSASPGIRLYAQQIARLGADAPEYEEVSQTSIIWKGNRGKRAGADRSRSTRFTVTRCPAAQ
jgi:hypothetical protein